MKGITVLSVSYVAFLLCLGTEGRKNGKSRGGKNLEGNNATLECFGEKLSETKWNFGLTECTQELELPVGQGDKPRGRKRKGNHKNAMCIKLCQRKKQGILEPNGKLSETGAAQFVEELFPVKARARIQRGLNRCAEDYVDGFHTDNNCKELRRFEKCFNRIVSKTCSMKIEGRGGKRRNGNKGKNKNHRRQHHDDEEEVEE